MTAPTEDDGTTDLIGALLRGIAAEPALLLSTAADQRDRAGIVRIANTETAPDFTTTLVGVFDEIKDALLGYAIGRLDTRDEAEDVAQTTFMRVFAKKPELDDDTALRGYLWTTAKNLVRNAQRRIITDRDRIDSDGEAKLNLLAARAGIPLADAVALRATLLTALETLAPREREAVVLRGYGGYSYAQTAEIMGVMEGTAKGYAHRGLAAIRAYLVGHP